MERFKENIQSRKEQNLASSVLTICFFMIALAFWGALSSDHTSAQTKRDVDTIVVAEAK